MSEDAEQSEHYSPAVRFCEILRPTSGSYGFHLSRTKWDPYPWVSVVDEGSAAQQAGLQVGDCLLEVNGEDVVGQKIAEVATRVRSRPDCASLLLWNCGNDESCDPEALCCGPMPLSLKRLSSCLSTVLGALECPVCLDTIPPPAHQCGNGHLVCAGCRARAERCPVCRLGLGRGRSLLADQVFLALTDTFNVNAATTPREEQSAKLRQKLLMLSKKKTQTTATPELKVSFSAPANKFLTKLMGKSSSLTNLATADEEPVRLSAVPRHLSITPEFSAELKVKSLSASEINRPSPASAPPSPGGPGSRSPNIPRAAAQRVGSGLLDAGFFPLGSSQRPASCHSSLESLVESEPALKESLFRCPWSSSCPLRLPTTRLVSHGRAHGGPVMLAFRSHCDLALPLSGPLCVQLPDHTGQPRELFVDTLQGPQGPLGPQGPQFLRAWLAGSPEDCLSWGVRVTLLGHSFGPGPAMEAAVVDVQVHSLSVDAPDLRSDLRDDNSRQGCALQLPAGTGRLGLDFAAVSRGEPRTDSEVKQSALLLPLPHTPYTEALR